MLLAVVLAVCLVLSFLLLRPGQEATAVRVISEGKVLYVLPLSVDTVVTVQTDRGENTVTVQDGKVAVTAADCPDGYCMDRGFCSGGAQIVCLPHRLVLQFADSGLDGISG